MRLHDISAVFFRIVLFDFVQNYRKERKSLFAASGFGKRAWTQNHEFKIHLGKKTSFSGECRLLCDGLDSDIKETCCKVGKQNIPVLSNGKYELAMIPLTGWEKTYTVYPEGVHPVSEKCALNMVSDQLSGEKIYVTLQLWKKNEKRGFTSKELTPVKSVHVSEDKKQVTVCLSNGEIKTISFE